ncbi:MAG: hypothetical protein ACJAW8_002895 [Oleispira sp.]|jgi:hypothetical protein
MGTGKSMAQYIRTGKGRTGLRPLTYSANEVQQRRESYLPHRLS